MAIDPRSGRSPAGQRAPLVVDNPRAVATVDLGAFGPPDTEPLAYHRTLPGYDPTRLLDAPALAADLGVERVWVKDESARLGLPSYKVLGASWAIDRLLREQPQGATLVAATDGNHGRAVARSARLRGLAARIYVPQDMAAARRDAIAGEGAAVVVVVGSYDDAVDEAAPQASATTLVVADTAYPGYETVPRWISQGYATIFAEIDDVVPVQPTVVAVQIGVGALAAAVVRRYRSGLPSAPRLLVGVEPQGADCVLQSVLAGELVEVPGPHRSIMSGLNAGRASPVAWPLVSTGIDLFVAVADDAAEVAMRDLARIGVVAGEAGAAGLAGLSAISDRLEPADRVLVLVTEGATDPQAYARILEQAT